MTKIRRCGHCGGSHDTIAQGRLCAHRFYLAKTELEQADALAKAELDEERAAAR